MSVRSSFVFPLVIVGFIGTLSLATAQESARIVSPLAEHMRLHFTAARALRSFVISGQMDGVPESAQWLIEHETPPGLPGDWAPFVADMRRYAEDAESAGHLVFAAEAVSNIARTCGSCHAANGVDVIFEEDIAAPPVADSVSGQMRGHLWAADRMWEGLIGPSDDAWNRGMSVLAKITLDASDFIVAADKEPALNYLLKRKRQIGEEGREARSGEARSALYAEFLAMCGDCHQLIGRGPQPPRSVISAEDE